MSRRKIVIPKSLLEQLYLQKNLSLETIGKKFNCSRETIHNRLIELEIPIKSSSAARMRYKKTDFSGSKIEKAYLIGFRLGDLNVYQTNKKSELIVARCNTTQDVQINLLKKLFFKYGKVTFSKGSYSTNINCFLNTSFNFLLPKHKYVPSWIKGDNETAAAFIAGYTDAEGNFILNQKRARFKLDTYDINLLRWISTWLKNQKLVVKFRRIGRVGEMRSNGTYFKHDIWRVNINDAISLYKFIRIIKPFSIHETRLRHMGICEINIQKRMANKTIKNEIN